MYLVIHLLWEIREAVKRCSYQVAHQTAQAHYFPQKRHLNIFPTVFFDEEFTVSTITLDEWAKENCIANIDFMWLDLQGMELMVLKSGVNILKSVKAIYTEVSIIEAYEGQTLYSDLKEWLFSNGFHIEREEVEKGGGNVFFIRKG